MGHCISLNDPDNVWMFCPALGPTYLFAILFFVTTCGHIFQAVRYRKFYCLVIILSGVLQTVAFAVRVVSIYYPKSIPTYTVWFVLILVAPLWTNAFVYMVMGRMVYNFIPSQRLFRVKARRFGLYFVLLDIVTFFVQVVGAVAASQQDASIKTINLGLHIYMIGVGLQQFFILVFLYMTVRFQRKISIEAPPDHRMRAKRLLYVIYTVLFLITVRIIFRLIEYAHGVESNIPKHEAYMYCFDSLPMLVAIYVFNFIHPGAIMPGKESDLPSRKQRKRAKQSGRANDYDLSDQTEAGESTQALHTAM